MPEYETVETQHDHNAVLQRALKFDDAPELIDARKQALRCSRCRRKYQEMKAFERAMLER